MENKKGPEFKHSLQDALQDALRSGGLFTAAESSK